jgi:hypothetical protein
MIINSAMINSKDVLEMKLNNSIVYSATPAVSYNYTMSFASGAIVTPPPSWLDVSKLTTGGFRFYNSVLNNTDTATKNVVASAYLGINLANCTKALKITIVCTPISSDANSLSRISIAPVAINGTMISSTMIYNKSGGGNQTTLTYTLTLDIINTAKSQGKNIGEIFIQHTNGWTNGSYYLNVYSIKIEEV